MTVWTISAELGGGGPEVAAELARRAGVALVDRPALVALAHELDPSVGEDDADQLERRVTGRFNALALGIATATVPVPALEELEFRRHLPDLARAVMREAARGPSVMLSHAAFAVLRDHPAAIHSRLRAPFDWRVANVQRCELLDRKAAERLVRRDDKLQHGLLRTVYHADLDDPTAFALTIDARLGRDRIVDVLLAAAGQSASMSDAAFLSASATSTLPE